MVKNSMGIFRFFHSSSFFQTATKSPLGLLRKKTGYSLANCRKALELHDNDPTKAEEWLREQAKELGWKAAIKVQERATAQGLVGIAVKNKKVAVVEVNCETDFVARNDKFRSIVELVASTCLELPILSSGMNTSKVDLNSEELKKLKANDISLADHLAILIGSVGENMAVRRAFCYETTREDIEIAVAVHPHSEDSKVLLGKYGSFVSFQRNPEVSPPEEYNLENFGMEMCKHIIGMNPKKIGEYEKDEPSSNANNEKVLIHQEFLLDDSVTVGQLLMENGIKILDFKRYECGEADDDKEIQSPASTENEEKEVDAAKN